VAEVEVEVTATNCLGWVVGVVRVVLPTRVVLVWGPVADRTPVDAVDAGWEFLVVAVDPVVTWERGGDERLLPA
jgi:hypothetical protein